MKLHRLVLSLTARVSALELRLADPKAGPGTVLCLAVKYCCRQRERMRSALRRRCRCATHAPSQKFAEKTSRLMSPFSKDETRLER